MNMRNFANYILAIAYENNLSVSNLKLQQVMYFALKTQKNNLELLSEIYDEPFYVWSYGPTVPSIYAKYYGYGSRAIIEKGKRDDKYSIFDNTIINLLNKDLFELIEKSRVNIHWQANKNKISKGISKVKYELEDI